MYVVGVVILIKVIWGHFSVVGVSEQRPDWSKWMREAKTWAKFFLKRENCKCKYPAMGTSLICISLTDSKNARILAANN